MLRAACAAIVQRGFDVFLDFLHPLPSKPDFHDLFTSFQRRAEQYLRGELWPLRHAFGLLARFANGVNEPGRKMRTPDLAATWLSDCAMCMHDSTSTETISWLCQRLEVSVGTFCRTVPAIYTEDAGAKVGAPVSGLSVGEEDWESEGSIEIFRTGQSAVAVVMTGVDVHKVLAPVRVPLVASVGLPVDVRLVTSVGLLVQTRFLALMGIPVEVRPVALVGLPVEVHLVALVGLPVQVRSLALMGLPVQMPLLALMKITVKVRLAALVRLPVEMRLVASVGLPVQKWLLALVGLPVEVRLVALVGLPVEVRLVEEAVLVVVLLEPRGRALGGHASRHAPLTSVILIVLRVNLVTRDACCGTSRPLVLLFTRTSHLSDSLWQQNQW
ncbi:hypothetical protein I4F81_002154 [Pyropia yezoensis]|uniref:Uncharacterized protein n=1 Tax=Pyropia yezoensis TaxID=2788 RepID=A0ACC3BNQ9_PYRYE|nr:hypothetical protein I4F81_002154 [Neopyropia yezoensis]